MSEPKFYSGDPPHEKERVRKEEEARKERMGRVRAARLKYRSEGEFDRALRAATAGEEFEVPGGGEE